MVLRHAYSNSHKDGRWPPLIILRRDICQRPDIVLSNRKSLKALNHLVKHGGYRNFMWESGYVDHCEFELNIMTVCPTINAERVARS